MESPPEETVKSLDAEFEIASTRRARRLFLGLLFLPVLSLVIPEIRGLLWLFLVEHGPQSKRRELIDFALRDEAGAQRLAFELLSRPEELFAESGFDGRLIARAKLLHLRLPLEAWRRLLPAWLELSARAGLEVEGVSPSTRPLSHCVADPTIGPQLATDLLGLTCDERLSSPARAQAVLLLAHRPDDLAIEAFLDSPAAAQLNDPDLFEATLALLGTRTSKNLVNKFIASLLRQKKCPSNNQWVLACDFAIYDLSDEEIWQLCIALIDKIGSTLDGLETVARLLARRLNPYQNQTLLGPLTSRIVKRPTPIIAASRNRRGKALLESWPVQHAESEDLTNILLIDTIDSFEIVGPRSMDKSRRPTQFLFHPSLGNPRFDRLLEEFEKFRTNDRTDPGINALIALTALLRLGREAQGLPSIIQSKSGKESIAPRTRGVTILCEARERHERERKLELIVFGDEDSLPEEFKALPTARYAKMSAAGEIFEGDDVQARFVLSEFFGEVKFPEQRR